MAVAVAQRTLTERSALELARAIREREVSAREVVDAHVEVLSRANRRINAVVADRYDAARRDADAVDERLAGDPDPATLPPLLGVPCTIKESIAVEGMPNCAGLAARAQLRAPRSAPVARRLLDAGAILLGVTNTSELCLWIESANPVYGRTSNAYDPRRIAGGSSGGEGAAVGSGGTPIGLGTDIGGSIRIPAFCNGVFGHKPSLGLVPVTGAWPPTREPGVRMLANGPLARRAEDLAPLLRILAGPDGEDPLVEAMEVGDPESVSLEGLPVVVSQEAWLRRVSGELLAARERAAGALAAAGANVQSRSMRDLRRALELYLATISGGGEITIREILEGEGIDLGWRDLVRRGGAHSVAIRIALAAERASTRFPARRVRKVLAAGESFAAEMAEAIGDGVLLHPPLTAVAPKHNRTVGRPWWVLTMAVFNLAGNPVTQVPLGLGRAGLPLGVQVAATRGRDHVSIAVALELERVFGGWVPPDPVN